MAAERRTVVQAGGRAKAYRPLPLEGRRAALAAGLEAYDRGDFFLAHELLEPAWMGTDDLGERAFLQGLIKLAAAFVHAARGNPAGITKNLTGALEHLLVPGADAAGAAARIDVPRLRDGISDQLRRPEPLAIRIAHVSERAQLSERAPGEPPS